MSVDRSKYLGIDEIQRLRATTEAQARPLAWMVVDLALSTGLRVSEMAALDAEDVDLERGCLRVIRRKRRKETTETLAIGKELVDHLRQFLNGRQSGPLFVGQRGPLTYRGLQQIWKAASRRAGLPKEFSIHSARHSIAVHLLKKTGNLRQVQKQLGHASPATTANMYADISFEDMQEGLNGLYSP
jgi:integrase